MKCSPNFRNYVWSVQAFSPGLLSLGSLSSLLSTPGFWMVPGPGGVLQHHAVIATGGCLVQVLLPSLVSAEASHQDSLEMPLGLEPTHGAFVCVPASWSLYGLPVKARHKIHPSSSSLGLSDPLAVSAVSFAWVSLVLLFGYLGEGALAACAVSIAPLLLLPAAFSLGSEVPGEDLWTRCAWGQNVSYEMMKWKKKKKKGHTEIFIKLIHIV